MESDEDVLGGGFNPAFTAREDYAQAASPVSPFQHHHTDAPREKQVGKGKQKMQLPAVSSAPSMPLLYCDNPHGISVVVRNPLKHNDGGNLAQAYTSYELYTEVSCASVLCWLMLARRS